MDYLEVIKDMLINKIKVILFILVMYLFVFFFFNNFVNILYKWKIIYGFGFILGNFCFDCCIIYIFFVY